MSTKSPIGRRIDEIVKYVFETCLRELGFRKAGRKIWRPEDGVFQRFDFQATMWGTATDSSFCVNLVVACPALNEAVSEHPLPKRRELCYPMIQERLHEPVPDVSDHWFPVRLTSNIASIGEEVIHLLNIHGFPWLTEFGGRDRLLAMFAQNRFHPALRGGKLAHSVLLAEAGLWKDAFRVHEQTEREYGTKGGYGETIVLAGRWLKSHQPNAIVKGSR